VKRRSSMINVRTLLMTSAFWLVDSLREHWSLSANMQPSLKRLNHSLIWVTPIALSPKTCLILRIVSAWVSQSFQTKLDAVLLLQASSRAKREHDEHVLHHFSIWWRQTHSAVSWGSKNSRMHMKVPSTTMLRFPTLSALLTAGKNIVWYFLDRVVNHTFCNMIDYTHPNFLTGHNFNCSEWNLAIKMIYMKKSNPILSCLYVINDNHTHPDYWKLIPVTIN
jgi:hypothetical protein